MSAGNSENIDRCIETLRADVAKAIDPNNRDAIVALESLVFIAKQRVSGLRAIFGVSGTPTEIERIKIDTEELLESVGEFFLSRQSMTENEAELRAILERLTPRDQGEVPEHVRTVFIKMLEASLRVVDRSKSWVELAGECFDLLGRANSYIDELERQIAGRNRGGGWREG